MPKTHWLDRRISAHGPYLCLCLSDAEYKAALKNLDVGAVDDWIKTPHANATTHHIASPKGLSCIVCMSGWENRDPVEIAGLLVHEAVHVWQEWCNHYGERTPGLEQEAYGIQSISQELMEEFSRRIKQSA